MGRPSEDRPKSDQENGDVLDAGSIGDLLRSLLGYKWVVLGVTAASLLAAYFWTAAQVRIYQADCTIEYDPNPSRPLGHKIEDTAAPLNYWASQEYFATQNKIMTSRAVTARVVRKLELHNDPSFMRVPQEELKGWKGATVARAALSLRARMTVEQERDTRLVHVRVSDSDPKRAALIANTIAESYLEKTLEDRLGASTTALEWLAKQLDSLKNQLEQSELSLHRFTEDSAKLAMPLAEQRQVITADIQRYSEKLSEARTRRIEMQARLTELQAANNEDPTHVTASIITSQEAIATLRNRLREVRAERDALAVRYGANHPELQAKEAALTAVTGELRREIDGIIQGAALELRGIEKVEQGVRAALGESNRAGLALELKEITFRRLQRQRDNTSKLYGTLLERTAETDLTRALEVSYARIVDRAILPDVPVSPRVRFTMAIGGLLGLVIAVALALLLQQLDRVIRGVEQVEAMGVTILGVVPRIEGSAVGKAPYAKRKRRRRMETSEVDNRDLVVHSHPQSSIAECCRTIRTNLTFMSADQELRSLLITSSSPREGKTTVTLSLAITMAQSGKRVLVVDTDLRRPRLHRALGVGLHRGVTTVLVGEHSLDEAVVSTDVPGLSLLAAGPIAPNPSELLHTAQFRDLVRKLEDTYDLVIYDSPPLTAVTDAAVVAPQIDGVLVVVRSDTTTRDALQSALRQLRDVRADLLGGVINDLDVNSKRYGYRGYYQYYYYRRDDYSEPGDGPPPSGNAQAQPSGS